MINPVPRLIPITALITPATLSVHLKTASTTTRMSVSTVEFTQDFWADWALIEGAGTITRPSYVISRLLATTSSSAAIIPLTPPLPNSSYTLEFWGPSYKCQNLSEVIAETKGIIYTDTLDNNYTFRDLWDEFEMKSSNNSNDRLYPVYSGSTPDLLNNTLFIATWEYPNDYLDNPTEESFVCKLWNTSYVLDISFNDTVQALVPISTELVAPCDWGWSADQSFTTQDPNYPQSIGGYYITHLLFSSLIKGSLILGSTLELAGDATQIMQSGLFECPELLNSSQLVQYRSTASPTCRNKTLARALEDLSRNFTYSLISLNAASTNVPVSVNSPKNFYSYDWKNLAAAYLTALVVTIVAIAIGFFALWGNLCGGMVFLRIILFPTCCEQHEIRIWIL